MNIPIEVVRKGLSEEYINAHTQMINAKKNLDKAKDEHEALLWELKDALYNSVAFFNDKTVAFLGSQEWKHASVVKEISDKVLEKAGKIAELRWTLKEKGEIFNEFLR